MSGLSPYIGAKRTTPNREFGARICRADFGIAPGQKACYREHSMLPKLRCIVLIQPPTACASNPPKLRCSFR